MSVRLEQSARTFHTSRCLSVRSINDELERRGFACLQLVHILLADAQDEFAVACSHLFDGFVDVCLDFVDLNPVFLQEANEIRRVLCAHDGNLERLFLAAHDALRCERGGDCEDDRCEQDPEKEGGEHYASVTQIFEHLLRKHYGDCAAHACSPLSAARTKASSRSGAPVCAKISAEVPRTTTRPAEMMTMSSHKAATSCITWLENSTQRPAARNSRNTSRNILTAVTSNPLVGSSRMIVCGRWISVRAKLTFKRSPWE